MASSNETEGPGLSSGQLRMVYPYHIAIDSSFNVTQVGDKLNEFLLNNDSKVIGNRIEHYFKLTSPPRVVWSWNQIWMFRSTTFHVKFICADSCHQLPLTGKWLLPETREKCFEMSGPNSALLLLDLDVSSTEELAKYGLGPRHLSLHGAKRDQLMSSELFNFRLKFDHDEEMRLLREETIRTQRTLESKRAFVRYISHEIRTPLNIVMMGLQLLEEAGERNLDGLYDIDGVDTALSIDNSSSGLLTDMRESCSAAVEILSDLLLSEKIEDNLMTVEATESNIAKLVSDVVRLFKIPAQSKRITLSTDLSGAAGALADLDRNKFNQVVRNLVSNALKFTPLGGRVTVTAERLCEDETPVAMAQSSIRSNLSVLQRLSSHNLMKLCQTSSTGTDVPAGLVAKNGFKPTSDSNSGSVDKISNLDITNSITNVNSNVKTGIQSILATIPPGPPHQSARDDRRGCGCCLRCACDEFGETTKLSNINSPRKARKVDETSRKHMAGRDVGTSSEQHTNKSPITDIRYGAGSGLGIGSNLLARSDSTFSGNGSSNCGINSQNVAIERQKSFQSEVSLFASMSSTSTRATESPTIGRSTDDLPMNDYGRRSMLRISVTDTGPGIAPEDQRMLFTQFTQIKAGQLQNGGGSGLGLWVSRSIMKAHGGDIGVISKSSGKSTGSTFYIDLPVLDKFSSSPYSSDIDLSLHLQTVTEDFTSRDRDGDADSCSITDSTTSVSEQAYSVGMILSDGSHHQTTDTIHTNIQNQIPQTNHLAQLQLKLPLAPINTVLIVDDSTTNRKFVSKLLKRHAKTIEEACDGQEAVNMCDGRAEYDVIMMDFVMPVMDGPTSVRELRRRGYRGLVIGVTGNLQQSDVEAFLASGVDRVMMKPLDVEQFIAYALEARDAQPTSAFV